RGPLPAERKVPPMRTFADANELAAAQGEKLGRTDWLTITQDRIDAFADATGDHQWIHVDRERAASGPFGTTIAHGYLSLSLLAYFGPQVFTLEKAPSMGINYGLNKEIGRASCRGRCL